MGGEIADSSPNVVGDNTGKLWRGYAHEAIDKGAWSIFAAGHNSQLNDAISKRF